MANQMLTTRALEEMRALVAAHADVDTGFPIHERCGCGPQEVRVVFHRRGSDECRAAG